MSIDSDVAIGRLEWCARVPMAMCNVQCCRVCTVGRITSTRTSPNVTTSGGSRCIGTAASCTLPFVAGNDDAPLWSSTAGKRVSNDISNQFGCFVPSTQPASTSV